MKNINEIKEDFTTKTIKKAIIFKNSTRCPISRAAKNEYEKYAQECEEEIELYIVDVIQNRKTSEIIEEETSVKHESPQVIYIENGTPKRSISHWEITKETLKKISR